MSCLVSIKVETVLQYHWNIWDISFLLAMHMKLKEVKTITKLLPFTKALILQVLSFESEKWVLKQLLFNSYYRKLLSLQPVPDADRLSI